MNAPITSILLSLAMVSGLSAFLTTSHAVEKRELPSDLKSLARGNNQFAWELYQRLRSQPGNLFISPYSISMALAMTTTGAAGATAEEMEKTLHLTGKQYPGEFEALQAQLLNQAKGFELRIANAIWGQKSHPFRPDFVDGLQSQFRSVARVLDFESDPDGSRRTINQWVEDQTKNRIQDLLPDGSITPLTKLVLTNAIYFKGKWARPFAKSATKPAEFTFSNGDNTKTDMMYIGGNHRYAETETLQLLELPYEGNQLSMLILLPRKKGGLAEVESSLAPASLDELLQKQRSPKVNVHLPRFKLTYEKSLSGTLKSLGMSLAFAGGQADFSKMDGTRELFISEVFHKAFCEVNEEGTEAAAATGVAMKAMAAPVEQPPVEFNANHPFIYLIRDRNSGSILFLGRMEKPSN